ncbi:MAG: MFS transporter [Limisphaerales bacterium]
MSPLQQFRVACFSIEGMNSFATILYFNYLYFLMRAKFGFSDQQNLMLAALLGLIYALAAWQAGKLAHRLGYFNALKLGFGLMILGLLAGAQLHSAVGVILAACVVNLGMCLTWPTLEALVSEAELPAEVPRALGIYNIVWAATYAFAFFAGGKLIEIFGFKAMFYIPASIIVLQFVPVLWLRRHVVEMKMAAANAPSTSLPPPDPHRPSPTKRKRFCAWPGWRILSPTSPSTHCSPSCRRRRQV